jgi:hypothetical protein
VQRTKIAGDRGQRDLPLCHQARRQFSNRK